jgi:type II secretory pathway component PulM
MERPELVRGAVARWERLGPRERRMLVALLGVATALAGFLVAFVIYDGLASLEERNDQARQALVTLGEQRDAFLSARRRAAQQEVRIPKQPLALASLLEAAATEAGIQIPDQAERPPTPRGKKYVEKGVTIKLRKVDLAQLSKFMQKIETGPNLVVVNKLRISTRFNQHDELDVEMNVSGYEHAAPVAPKGKGAAGVGVTAGAAPAGGAKP